MDNGKDLNQALAWFNKAAEMQPDAYWVYHQRANCPLNLERRKKQRHLRKIKSMKDNCKRMMIM
jgi:hypothetical protein